MVEIVDAQIGEMDQIRRLLGEYAASLDFDLSFRKFKTEIEELPGDYRLPAGCILVAKDDDVAAGCVALQEW